MNLILVAVLAIACFVLAADLITTYLRNRARSGSVALEPTLAHEDLGDEPKEGAAIE